jgi:hypothetical protein
MSEIAQGKRVIGRPFQPGNPGRPKGVRHKLTENFLKSLMNEWDRRGDEAIQQLTPKELVEAVGKLVPKDINITNEENLSEADIRARLAELDAVLGPIAGAVAVKAAASRNAGTEKPH